MGELTRENVLNEITRFFLSSADFNGLPTRELIARFGGNSKGVRNVLQKLISEEVAGVVYADSEVNPHIIRTHFESIDVQLAKLAGDTFMQSCVYPRSKHLKDVVDASQFEREPYKLCLALGEPQLSYRSFDLSVLEFYRNDPRYMYKCSDVEGSISVRDEYYGVTDMERRDQVLLQSFGFSYDADFNRAVAVFLRYLADLSPEHQQIWRSKELSGDFRLHPDYFRHSIIGDWGECVPIFDAFLQELWLINRMSRAMERPPLFRRDFGEYGEDKPANFGFLIRPTLEEFSRFILLLDQMLSDNINKGFFQGDVAYETEVERKDGKVEVRPKGTLQILDEWLRTYFRTSDWEPWEKSIRVLREVRKKRQKPAHTISENNFDQRYFKEQRRLIIDTYGAVRTLRMMLENHPSVRGSDIIVPDSLREGKIWTY